jgi:tetracycline repressor-like protein
VPGPAAQSGEGAEEPQDVPDGGAGVQRRLLRGDTEPAPPADGEAADPAGPGWQHTLRGFAHAARDLSLRHPWAAMLLFSRPAVVPDAVRAVDLLYAALLEAGVPAPDVPRMERLVSTFVLGRPSSTPTLMTCGG